MTDVWIQWIVVGIVILAAVVWIIRRSRRGKDGCDCGCGGCRLKDNCGRPERRS